MLQKDNQGLYRSTLLSEIAGVTHGYSTRQFGDSRKAEIKMKILRLLNIEPAELFEVTQVHGARITTVDGLARENAPGADGLVQKVNSSQSSALAVYVADCVPILLVEPKRRVMAAIHAGWKGTLSAITTRGVEAMRKLGVESGDIFASIGPHIGMCHYDVPEERARLFLASYGNDRRMASKFNGKWHLDIGYVNWRQLVKIGIPREHIDAPTVCTVCQNDEFFSYRKDSQVSFGEILGVVGLTAYGKKFV